MSVFPQRDLKVRRIFSLMENLENSESLFIELFKKEYPKDWLKIVNSYDKHKKINKPGKIQPMPEPTQYLINTYKVYSKKLSSENSLK